MRKWLVTFKRSISTIILNVFFHTRSAQIKYSFLYSLIIYPVMQFCNIRFENKLSIVVVKTSVM